MAQSFDYDVIVIGSGPGGEGTAMKSVKSGGQVAVIDDKPKVGGNCTHRATIPSKALRHAIQVLADTGAFRGADFQDLLQRTKSVISEQVDLRQRFYERNHLDVFHGRARFVDPHTIEVDLNSGGVERYSAAGFIIATGSRPYHPPDVDFSHPRIVDSDTVLDLDQSPRSITIYGAGVIGCEYASIFRGLRIKVNLINSRRQLLSFLDDEIIDALAYHLRDQGVMIRHNEEFLRVEADDIEVRLSLKSNKEIRSDILLWAQGRTGNSDRMGLEEIGIETDKRGSIVINVKILFNRETLEILGIHCFGYQASEIIHIGQAILAQKSEANTLMYFINTTFNYPPWPRRIGWRRSMG